MRVEHYYIFLFFIIDIRPNDILSFLLVACFYTKYFYVILFMLF